MPCDFALSYMMVKIISCVKVSISSAERIQKEGGKPGEIAQSKKGKDKGKEAKEVRTSLNSVLYLRMSCCGEWLDPRINSDC